MGIMTNEREHENRVEMRKATDPFDVLAEQAIEEYKDKRTTDLRSLARELGIDLSNHDNDF